MELVQCIRGNCVLYRSGNFGRGRYGDDYGYIGISEWNDFGNRCGAREPRAVRYNVQFLGTG